MIELEYSRHAPINANIPGVPNRGKMPKCNTLRYSHGRNPGGNRTRKLALLAKHHRAFDATHNESTT